MSFGILKIDMKIKSMISRKIMISTNLIQKCSIETTLIFNLKSYDIVNFNVYKFCVDAIKLKHSGI